jgi:hypothetical protein
MPRQIGTSQKTSPCISGPPSRRAARLEHGHVEFLGIRSPVRHLGRPFALPRGLNGNPKPVASTYFSSVLPGGPLAAAPPRPFRRPGAPGAQSAAARRMVKRGTRGNSSRLGIPQVAGSRPFFAIQTVTKWRCGGPAPVAIRSGPGGLNSQPSWQTSPIERLHAKPAGHDEEVRIRSDRIRPFDRPVHRRRLYGLRLNISGACRGPPELGTVAIVGDYTLTVIIRLIRGTARCGG